jgi:hypothetical protein
VSVDVRTRVDGAAGRAGVDADPDELWRSVLPQAFDARREQLAAAAAWLAPPPLTVSVGGAAWTLEAADGVVSVRPGPIPGSDVLSLTFQDVTDLVADQVTPMGWFASGALQLDGHLSHLLDWWLLLRAALDGTAPTLPGTIDFTDGTGARLDLRRSFSRHDPPEAMRQFLEEAGYLHLRGVFSEEEMAAVSDDMDRAAPHYSPRDGRSWWATTVDGTERLVRMEQFDHQSATVASMVTDERLESLARLCGDGHQWPDPEANRIEALFKPIGVVRGISDVPWHKDCSLGRHSYECCSLTVGISVIGAGPQSGQLQVVAGSHRAHMWPALLQPGLDLPVVELPTATGDVTVHLSCTLHMAQPPTERERRVLYAGLPLPPSDASAAAAARARLRQVREAAPVSVSQPPVAAGVPPARRR